MDWLLPILEGYTFDYCNDEGNFLLFGRKMWKKNLKQYTPSPPYPSIIPFKNKEDIFPYKHKAG